MRVCFRNSSDILICQWNLIPNFGPLVQSAKVKLLTRSQWKGLVSKYDLAQNLVYWNSIGGVVSGFKGTTGKI
jgi:hypothetical protein